jgi:hypothetical protein
MGATRLAQDALWLPVGSLANRPSGAAGEIRYSSTENFIESFRNYMGPNLYGAGVSGEVLVARVTSKSAWNYIDVKWGYNANRFAAYKIHIVWSDPASNSARLYGRFFDIGDNLLVGSSYSYTDMWGASNDGGDYAGTNYSPNNGTLNDTFPLSCWFPGDSGYWTIADGESVNASTMTVWNSLPTSFGSNLVNFQGTYVHRTPSYGTGHGQFSGHVHATMGSTTADNVSVNVYPLTGLRIGYHDGITARASSNQPNIIVTVYGLAGFEYRNLNNP